MKTLRTFTCLLLGLLSGAPVLADDTVSRLPAAWETRLEPVARPEISALEENVQAGLVQARETVNLALQEEGTAPAKLAAAYGELAGLYHVHTLYTAAEHCYANARALDPENFRWAYYSAYLAAQEGRTRVAVTRFLAAQALRPDYAPLTLRLADAWRDLNEPDKAAAAYRKVINSPGLEVAARFGLGQIALLERDYASATGYFTQALELDPEATRIHYPLAQALRAAGDSEAARRHLALRGDRLPLIRDDLVEALQAMKSGARVHYVRAMKAILARDYPAAAEAFTEGLAMEPGNAAARVSYARTLYLSGDKAGARQALETALETQPDNTLALFLLGVLQDEAGDSAPAANDYRQVLKLDPAHDGANFYLANHYYRQGKLSAAGEHYARTVAADPRNLPPVLLHLAILEQTDTADRDMKRHIERALQGLPEQPFITLRRIRLLASSRDAQVRDPQRALELAGALAAQQPIPPHREALALAYAATGDFEQAAEIQEELMSFAIWSMPSEADRLAQVLAAYRENKLPDGKVLAGAPLPPPQVDGSGPFRDYPAARPY